MNDPNPTPENEDRGRRRGTSNQNRNPEQLKNEERRLVAEIRFIRAMLAGATVEEIRDMSVLLPVLLDHIRTFRARERQTIELNDLIGGTIH